jgi:type VI secretion system protein ImpB
MSDDSMSRSNDRRSFAAVRLLTPKDDGQDTGELPFIVGVIDDFAGNAQNPSALEYRDELRKRKFDRVSRDTAARKMEALSPGVEFGVRCTLPYSEKDTLHVKLNFNEMADFDPARVAQQIPELNRLLDLRKRLVALKTGAVGAENREKLTNSFVNFLKVIHGKREIDER